MKRSGFLRRVFMLVAFGIFYSYFVINSQIIWNPEHRVWLHWLLIGAIGWGVISMLADRLGTSEKGEENHDEDK